MLAVIAIRAHHEYVVEQVRHHLLAIRIEKFTLEDVLALRGRHEQTHAGVVEHILHVERALQRLRVAFLLVEVNGDIGQPLNSRIQRRQVGVIAPRVLHQLAQ